MRKSSLHPAASSGGNLYSGSLARRRGLQPPGLGGGGGRDGGWEGPELGGQPELGTAPNHPRPGQKRLFDRWEPSLDPCLYACAAWGLTVAPGLRGFGEPGISAPWSHTLRKPRYPKHRLAVNPALPNPSRPACSPEVKGLRVDDRVAVASAVPSRVPGGPTGGSARPGLCGERHRGRLEPEFQPPC